MSWSYVGWASSGLRKKITTNSSEKTLLLSPTNKGESTEKREPDSSCTCTVQEARLLNRQFLPVPYKAKLL